MLVTTRMLIKKVPNRKATKSDKKTGLYVGETSRCLFERSNEHIDGMLNGDDKNFIIKHWALKHSKLETPPEKKFSVIKTHQDALSRVIQEAILIECDADINSKSEWRQNAKPRLVIEQTNKQIEKEDIEMAIANWEQQKLIDAIILKVTRMKDEKDKNDEKGVVGEKNVVDDGKIYRNNKVVDDNKYVCADKKVMKNWLNSNDEMIINNKRKYGLMSDSDEKLTESLKDFTRGIQLKEKVARVDNLLEKWVEDNGSHYHKVNDELDSLSDEKIEKDEKVVKGENDEKPENVMNEKCVELKNSEIRCCEITQNMSKNKSLKSTDLENIENIDLKSPRMESPKVCVNSEQPESLKVGWFQEGKCSNFIIEKSAKSTKSMNLQNTKSLETDLCQERKSMNFCMEKSAKSPNVQSLQSPKLSVNIGQRLCGSETSNIDQKTLKSMIVEGCKKSLSYPTKSLRKQVVLSPELHSCQKSTKTAPFWNNLYNHVVVCEESKSSKDSLMLGEGYKKLYTFKFKTTKSGIWQLDNEYNKVNEIVDIDKNDDRFTNSKDFRSFEATKELIGATKELIGAEIRSQDQVKAGDVDTKVNSEGVHHIRNKFKTFRKLSSSQKEPFVTKEKKRNFEMMNGNNNDETNPEGFEKGDSKGSKGKKQKMIFKFFQNKSINLGRRMAQTSTPKSDQVSNQESNESPIELVDPPKSVKKQKRMSSKTSQKNKSRCSQSVKEP